MFLTTVKKYFADLFRTIKEYLMATQTVSQKVRGVLTNACCNGDKAAKAEFRKLIEQSVVDAVVALSAKGIEPKWLCANKSVPAVDALALVDNFLVNNPDVNVEELQAKFTCAQVCEGLTAPQLASLKPVVETPVVEAVKKEQAKCNVTKKYFDTDKLAVPDKRSMQRVLQKDDLTVEDLLAVCKLPQFLAPGWAPLDLALEAIREETSVRIEREEKHNKWLAFLYDLRRGEIGEFEGQKFVRCGQRRDRDGEMKWCNRATKLELIRVPMLQVMIDNNPFMIPARNKDGNVVTDEDGRKVYVPLETREGPVFVTPTVGDMLRKFACCPECATLHGIDTEESGMDYFVAEVVVAEARAIYDANEAARKARMQNNGNNGGGQQNRGNQHENRDDRRDRMARFARSMERHNSQQNGNRSQRPKGSYDLADLQADPNLRNELAEAMRQGG